jgi:iron complex outermembrane receptor protein
MKITAIILLTACMAASAKGLTQTVSLSVKEERLDKVFAEIKKQTGYSFFYTDDQLQKAKRVTVRLNNVQLLQALDAVFAEQPFSYQVIDKMIVIKQKDP